MGETRAEVIESMKMHCLSRVDEWIGMDVPDEGTEDYDTWQSKLADIDAIDNIDDVIEYVENSGWELDEFFVVGLYDVITAGLDPSQVPRELITQAGELVAEKQSPGRSGGNVYLFDGKYFIVNDGKTRVADTKAKALKIAGIKKS